ncbi:MAG: hypothetical protein M1829_000406 [Trizodia sp. TS-e1964]|nr:MAG: hypothetical protein M1829_000406 [Trizodia sp. TS-e1964]
MNSPPLQSNSSKRLFTDSSSDSQDLPFAFQPKRPSKKFRRPTYGRNQKLPSFPKPSADEFRDPYARLGLEESALKSGQNLTASFLNPLVKYLLPQRDTHDKSSPNGPTNSEPEFSNGSTIVKPKVSSSNSIKLPPQPLRKSARLVKSMSSHKTIPKLISHHSFTSVSESIAADCGISQPGVSYTKSNASAPEGTTPFNPSCSIDKDSDSELSTPPESPNSDSPIEQPKFNFLSSAKSPSVSLCPMCKQIVEPALFQSYDTGGRMNVRKQRELCTAHRRNSARHEWDARGYPTIDWQKFQVRVEQFYGVLDNILRGKQKSHFREALRIKVDMGNTITLKKSIMTTEFRVLTPGYYGPRGARAMMEIIMSRFSPIIREIAAKDRLISSGGVLSYVQAVLVPELAVLLIKEDMGVDNEMARSIMEASIDIGDLVNEEQDEEDSWQQNY